MDITHIDERSLEGILDGLMPFLHCTIGCSVVCRGELDSDIEGLHDVSVQVGNEGVPIVRDSYMWKAKPGSPFHECPAAFFRCCLFHGETFQPPGSPAEDAEDILESVGRGEGTHHIQMDSRKSLIWYWELAHSGLDSR